MKYERFEDVPAWKAAARFYVEVEELVEGPAFRGHGDLKSQLLRAAMSVSNNIAEGFERGTTAELIAPSTSQGLGRGVPLDAADHAGVEPSDWPTSQPVLHFRYQI